HVCRFAEKIAWHRWKNPDGFCEFREFFMESGECWTVCIALVDRIDVVEPPLPSPPTSSAAPTALLSRILDERITAAAVHKALERFRSGQEDQLDRRTAIER